MSPAARIEALKNAPRNGMGRLLIDEERPSHMDHV